MIAGGEARRFGRDKALALLDGRPLIDHAMAQIAGAVTELVVCGPERPDGDLPGIVWLADLPHPGLGPLGGIAAALDHAHCRGFEAVLTIACDMPSVPPSLLNELIAARPSYCADAPILGCWPVEALPGLLDLLGSDNGRAARSIRRWAEAIGAEALPSPAPLRNINTPGDLA